MKRLILASASPRRREILDMLGYDFDVVVPECDENTGDMPANDMVKELSKRKALSVAEKYPSAVVIGSDTLVTIDGEVLGKPADRDDAMRMIKKLSGRQHTVFTGVTVVCGADSTSFVSAAQVEFYPFENRIADWYLSGDEPYDKAGAYAVQGKGAMLIKKIDGDFFTVMGLPAAQLGRCLREFGIKPLCGAE